MKRRRRSGEHEEGAAGMERWLLTYADMITLLLALFVILFAISVVNGKKFIAFEQGLTAAFNTSPMHSTNSSGLLPQRNSLVSHPSVTTTTIAPTTSTTPTSAAPAGISRIASELNQALSTAGLSQYATVTVSRGSVVVQMLADKAYFATDSATLGAVGDQVVDTVASVLRDVPNDVRVQGYTDNEPITGGPFTSNWELSAVRAVNVVRRLETQDGITKTRLSAIGFGTTRPVVPNTSPANQAENRRVDVVVLTAKLPASSVPARGRITP